MAKIGDKEKQARALREARLNSSRGGVESGHTHLVANIGCGRSGDVRPGPPASGIAVPITGVTSSPRETKSKSSDAARAVPARKPKPVSQPPSPKASAAASGSTTHQYRDPEKRKAYMAKYMRDRRRREAEKRSKEKK